MDVSDNDKTFNIRIETPLMLSDDFNTMTTYDFIIIRAEKRNPEDLRAKDTGCVFFHLILSLPESAIPARAAAYFSNGILTIVVPKKGSCRELMPGHVSSI